jgi:ATP-dependent helicase/nuclease subunit A
MSAVLDAARRPQRAAANPEISAWVSANAGSGKTRVLVERVIRLLLEGTNPERILCLTFTKAAAAEMSDRLFRTLGQWSLLPDDQLIGRLSEIEGRRPSDQSLIRARKLFASAIETPGGLKIQTIHAFAQSLLRRFPQEAGIAPHFAVMDDREARVLMTAARDQVFANAKDGGAIAQAIAKLIPAFSEGGFDELLNLISHERGALRLWLRRHGRLNEALSALRASLGIANDLTLEALDDETSHPPYDLNRAAQALAQGKKTDQERAIILQRLAAGSPSSDLLDEYRQVFLTADGKGRSLERWLSNDAKSADPNLLDVMAAEMARILEIEDRRKSVHVADLAAASFQLGLAVLDAFDIEKRRRARLDYSDLIESSLDLLSGRDAAPWVLFKLDGGLDHILVDEAQDTSPAQWAIIQKLTDEFSAGEGRSTKTRTVFAVGDPKQSIYSFQGADPTGFDRMRHYFTNRLNAARLPFEPVALTQSFRSTPEILDIVDQIFLGPAARGLTEDGLAIRHVAARATIPGRVELWEPAVPAEVADPIPWDAPLDQESNRSPRHILAERIAAKIQDWLSPNGEKIADDQSGKIEIRDVRPGDILILVHRRDAFVDEMIRALKQAQIPVAGADRMRLDAQIAVMDLSALAQVCLLPEDDLTLACLLKSPLVGFDEIDLFDLAHTREGISLWTALRQSARPKDQTAYQLISGWRDLARRTAPFDFFAHVLNAGGRKRLLARLGPEANDPINELLSQALNFEQIGTPSLQAFVHWLAGADVEIKRDMDQSSDLVRVMTVHGAKGLEANIVILPDTFSNPTGHHGRQLMELGSADSDGAPMALAISPLRSHEPDHLKQAREHQEAQDLGEHHRLLYVALTRARNWLYIGGYRTKSDAAPPKGLTWYELCAPTIRQLGRELEDETGQKVWRVEYSASISAISAPKPTSTAAITLPAWLGIAPLPERRGLRAITPSRLEGQDQSPRAPFGPANAKRYQRGRLIHRLLQTLPDLDRPLRAEAARRYLAHAAQDMGAEDQRALVDETLAVLNTPDFIALFGPNARAEVPLTGTILKDGQPILIAGQVDRLLVTDTEVLIVDFKTNRPPPQRAEDIAALYLRQMAAYRAALRSLYPQHTIRTALVWTDGPRMMALGDALLDQAWLGVKVSS